jgi:hypothetical protein
MDEQGLPQVTNAELIADLEASLLELRCRLNNYLDLGVDDVIAADEGFNFAGQLQATPAEVAEHIASIRERLEEIQSKGLWVLRLGARRAVELMTTGLGLIRHYRRCSAETPPNRPQIAGICAQHGGGAKTRDSA